MWVSTPSLRRCWQGCTYLSSVLTLHSCVPSCVLVAFTADSLFFLWEEKKAAGNMEIYRVGTYSMYEVLSSPGWTWSTSHAPPSHYLCEVDVYTLLCTRLMWAPPGDAISRKEMSFILWEISRWLFLAVLGCALRVHEMWDQGGTHHVSLRPSLDNLRSAIPPLYNRRLGFLPDRYLCIVYMGWNIPSRWLNGLLSQPWECGIANTNFEEDSYGWLIETVSPAGLWV